MKSRYLRLVRPIAWIVFLFPFAAGFGLGVTSLTSQLPVFFGFIAFSLAMSFGFSVNAISDIKVDRYHDGRSKDMNLAQQPLVTGEITLKKTTYLVFLFFVLSLFFASLINLFFFLLILFVDIAGYIYSMPPTRVKEKPVGDILCNALLGMLFFIAGLSIGGANIHPVIIVGVFFMAATFYIPTVITDYEFDKKAGLKTSAVFLGPFKLIRVMYILTALVVLTGIIVYLISTIELQLLSVLMISYTIIITGVSRKKLHGERLSLHENWILVPFSFISLLFIIYGILKLTGLIVLGN